MNWEVITQIIGILFISRNILVMILMVLIKVPWFRRLLIDGISFSIPTTSNVVEISVCVKSVRIVVSFAVSGFSLIRIRLLII